MQLLKFIRDEDLDEWAKLISIQHIDMAIKPVKRIALAFHLAFLISFTQCLDLNELDDFFNDLEIGYCASLSEKWSKNIQQIYRFWIFQKCYIFYAC